MTPRDLVIVGAGGFARETVELVRAADPGGERWRPLGIVDDDPARSGSTVAGLAVIGPVDSVRDGDAAVVVCVGNPSNFVARAMIVDRLGLDDDRYATLVHPSAVVPPTATLGAGAVLHAGVVLTTDVRVGRHVAVMPAVVLTHDDVVGDFATFGAGVRIGGGCSIGTGAYLGAGSVVRESTAIGPWSLVGAGSVVLDDVPSGEVWVGNPARRLRRVELVGDLVQRLDAVPPTA
jgi:sugar O-acyltransferase (sialic acid O-acetyltransferase NeuD family)